MDTTDDVVAFLATCVGRSEGDGAPLPKNYGVFARAYHRFTLAICAYLQSGAFEDPAWIADFDVRFARRYRFGLENPTSCGAPWRIAFAAADNPSPRAIRHLMLGINAHMSYDLVEVLLEPGVVDGKTERRRDFLAVNGVIAKAVPSIDRLIEDHYGEHLRAMDMLSLNASELLTEDTFADWRGRSWDDAAAIRAGKLTLDDVEKRVARRARLLGLLPV